MVACPPDPIWGFRVIVSGGTLPAHVAGLCAGEVITPSDEVDRFMENRASRPLAWRFADLLDIETIQQLQDAFAEAHHVATIITDPDGAAITRISQSSLLAAQANGETEVPRPLGAAAVVRDAGVWSGSAAIGLEGVHLAEWRVSRGPDMAPERFDRICGFLQQAAELVSHQARMQAEINAERAARLRAEAERDRLDQHLRLSAGLGAVGRLAGGVAHDFGNLLTAIMAYADQLTLELDDPDDPDAPAVRILSAADRAADLVRRLLEVARHEPGTTTTVDVTALVAETASLLEPTLPAGVRITQTVHGVVRPIAGDSGCLHAALLNLGINASHAMPRGGDLAFSARERELALGPHVEIRVSDTGEGMDDETQRRIFDPFFTTRADVDGTGLGLTQARSCIEGHGGVIEVTSEVGRGTVFTILLPISNAARSARRETG